MSGVTTATAVTVAAMAAATALQAGSSIAAGNAARREGNFKAAQLDQAAGQERATAQRQAIEETRKADLATSRAEAVAGASGTGGKGITDIIGGIQGQGEYNALTALFNGEEQARGMELQGATARMQGRAARKAGVMTAVTTIASNAASYGMQAKYGATNTAAATPASTYAPWQAPGNVNPRGGYY